MLADTPNIDDPTRGERFLPEGLPEETVQDGRRMALPIRRIGLEHEFFLVDRKVAPRDLADLFLRECRQAAQARGLDPHCFKAESVMGMVEITTPPTCGVGEMIAHYLDNLGLALEVASELDLTLYPLGTYPLPISPALRDDPSYALKATTRPGRRGSRTREGAQGRTWSCPPAPSGPM